MDFREGLLEAFSSPSAGERKRFVGGKRVLGYRTNGFRLFLGCRSALGMLLDALGVLLGGPWAPKKVQSQPTGKVGKTRKTNDPKNSPNHYAYKLKRISDNRKTRESRLGNGFPGRLFGGISKP